MANITIRNLDDAVKTRLRVRAAGNGRSMEEEVRLILREAVQRNVSTRPENSEASTTKFGQSVCCQTHMRGLHRLIASKMPYF